MNDKTSPASPAPWRVEAGDSVVGIYSPAGRVAITNTKTFYQRHDARDIANANLIAAAPELLDALKELRTLVEMDDWWCDPADSNYPLRHQVEAAIAKAEGRTNLADANPNPPLSDLSSLRKGAEELRRKLAGYAITEEYDFPGDAPEFCGFWCNECKEHVEADGSGHRDSCLCHGERPQTARAALSQSTSAGRVGE